MARYPVGNCYVELVTGDITRETTDAIVNAANASLAPGGGVCGAIHRAAGRELAEECEQVRRRLPNGRLETGKAAATKGFRLPARYVIHAVGPVFDADPEGAPALLASAYADSLRLARELGLASIAFPAISTGIFGYPMSDAARVALRAIKDDIAAHGAPALVKMVLFDAKALSAFTEAAGEIF